MVGLLRNKDDEIYEFYKKYLIQLKNNNSCFTYNGILQNLFNGIQEGGYTYRRDMEAWTKEALKVGWLHQFIGVRYEISSGT